jgi:hypothetical protein
MLAAPLGDGHTYRFRVRSFNALGEASDWSVSLDFTIG